MNETMSKSAISLFLISATLTGCGWVDSTGAGAQEEEPTTPSDPGIALPVVKFESVAPPLMEGQAIVLSEGTANRTNLEGRGSSTQNWIWELQEDKDGSLCEGFDGYDNELAAQSLTDACTDESLCEITIEEEKGASMSEFIISVPILKAPVALNYTLSAELDDGELIQRNQTLCAISINEKPVTQDDNYSVKPGEALIVMANDADSLLSNDSDDIDVRNEALSVNIRLIEKPMHASQFNLKSSGEFFYRAPADITLDENGRLIDTFVYGVTDGLHTAVATATIVISEGNQGPQLIGDLPDRLIDLSEAGDNRAYQIDVSTYFIDFNNDPLSYALELDYLPAGLKFQINDQGLLSIIVASSGQNTETGSWTVNVIVSDGLLSARASFLLTVLDPTANTINQPPTVSDIANKTVQDTFTYDVSIFFSDPDGDPLTFSAEVLPPGVTLSAAGLLSGQANQSNSRRWLINVTATDPSGNAVDDSFALQIKD